MKIRIVIDGDKATQYFPVKDGWKPVTPKKTIVSQMKDMCVLSWLNEGGVWTEHQVFSLSYINKSKLNLAYLRHVTNRKEDKDGEPFNLRGEGELTRTD